MQDSRTGDAEVDRMLEFRNRLRTDADALARYQNTKPISMLNSET